jgi:hypothetical protein
MTVSFQYGVGYTPQDSDVDPNRFYFSPGFSGYPSDSIKAQAVYGTVTVPLYGYFDDSTAFVVTAGNFQGTPDLVTFYPLFTISYVSSTSTSITFAWSGLPQPTNVLRIGCSEDLIDQVVGNNQPASGQYTVTGLTPYTNYYGCYFEDGLLTNFGTNSIDASTTGIPFEYGVGYTPQDSDVDPNRFYFLLPFSGYPTTTIQALAVYEVTTVPLEGYFAIDVTFVVTVGNFQGTPDLVTFYPLFTISYVSSTQTSITFAWDGLPPENDLYLELNNGELEFSVGIDQPVSGTYTATGLTPSTTYTDCYFYNGIPTNTIDASTVANRWQLVQTLTPSHVAISSALSADGSTIISGSGDLSEVISSFPACIFRLIDGQFQEVTTIPPSSEGYFGEEVAVDARGQVFGISCTNGNIIQTPDRLSGLDSKLVTFNLESLVNIQGNVALGGYVNSNLIPGQDNLYTLGTIGNRWKSLQLGPGTLYITDQTTGQQAGLSVNNGKLLIDNVEGIRTGNLFLTDIVTNVLTQLQVSAGTLLLNGIQGIRTGNVNFVDSQTGYQATMNVVNQVLTFSNVNTVKTSNVSFTDGTVQTTAYTKPTANVYPTSPTISSLTIDMSSSNSYIHCHCNGQLSLSVSNPRPAKQIQLFAYWGGGGSNYITTGGGWNTIATTGTNPYYVTKQFCVVTVTSMDYTLSNVFMVIGN